MSINLINLRDCPVCGSRANTAVSALANTYFAGCDVCRVNFQGNTLYMAVTRWNQYADRKAEEISKKNIPTKSATDIINEVRDAMCNEYCRYMHEGAPALTAEDNSYYEENGCLPQCDDCPLNRL